MTAIVQLEDHDGVDCEHWLLECDVCAIANFECPTKEDSELLGAQHGWTRSRDGGHICPACRAST